MLARKSALLVVAVALIALAARHGIAAETADAGLAAMTDRELVEYTHDRFEWLNGEARVSHNLSTKFHRRCRPNEPSASDGARACEIAKAADERSASVLAEEGVLLHDLEQRFGGVPRWARAADAQLRESLRQ